MPPILLKETNPELGKAFFSSGGCRSCLCLFPLRKSTLTCLLFPGPVQLNHHKVRLAGGGDGVGYAGLQTWLWLQAPFFISWVAWGLEIAPTVISVLSTELWLKEWELPMFMKSLTYWKTAGSRHQEARPKIQHGIQFGHVSVARPPGNLATEGFSQLLYAAGGHTTEVQRDEQKYLENFYRISPQQLKIKCNFI